jgi:hypothetical protein
MLNIHSHNVHVTLNDMPQEKRPREAKLGSSLAEAIDFINRTLGQKQVHHIAYDFSRAQKLKQPLLETLTVEAMHILHGTGVFCSHRPSDHSVKSPLDSLGGFQHAHGREQRGIARTNCVDCLDRTNVGQLIIARAALGMQLAAMCISPDEHGDRHEAVMGTLAQMYAEMGDRLAQQYAGTDAHAKGGEQSGPGVKDKFKSVLVSISRYYQNSFSDVDKQKAMDLFLGAFVPRPGSPHIWEVDIEDSFGHRGMPTFVCTGNSLSCRPWFKDALSAFSAVPRVAGPTQSSHAQEREGDSHEAARAHATSDAGHEAGRFTSFDELLSRSYMDAVVPSASQSRTPSALTAAVGAAEHLARAPSEARFEFARTGRTPIRNLLQP